MIGVLVSSLVFRIVAAFFVRIFHMLSFYLPNIIRHQERRSVGLSENAFDLEEQYLERPMSSHTLRLSPHVKHAPRQAMETVPGPDSGVDEPALLRAYPLDEAARAA